MSPPNESVVNDRNVVKSSFPEIPGITIEGNQGSYTRAETYRPFTVFGHGELEFVFKNIPNICSCKLL